VKGEQGVELVLVADCQATEVDLAVSQLSMIFDAELANFD